MKYTFNISFRKSSKTRQGRATRRQIEALVSYLEEHPHVASGKFNIMNAKENLQGCWEDLCNYLNSLSSDGKQKDIKSWKTVSKNSSRKNQHIFYNTEN